MAKPELTQTQRNQALADLRSMVSSKQYSMKKEPYPDVVSFIGANVKGIYLANFLKKFVGQQAECSYHCNSYTFKIDLLRALDLTEDYKKLCDAVDKRNTAKISKFQDFTASLEMKIKYGDSAQSLIDAFESVKAYKF